LKESNRTGTTNGTRTTYPSAATEFTFWPEEDGQTIQLPEEDEQTIQWPEEDGQTIQWPEGKGQTMIHKTPHRNQRSRNTNVCFMCGAFGNCNVSIFIIFVAFIPFGIYDFTTGAINRTGKTDSEDIYMSIQHRNLI
jgi:hypothetical protein